MFCFCVLMFCFCVLMFCFCVLMLCFCVLMFCFCVLMFCFCVLMLCFCVLMFCVCVLVFCFCVLMYCYCVLMYCYCRLMFCFCVLMFCFCVLKFCFCVLMHSLCSRFLYYCSIQITKQLVCTLFSVFPPVRQSVISYQNTVLWTKKLIVLFWYFLATRWTQTRYIVGHRVDSGIYWTWTLVFNPYMPSVLLVGHMQTIQTQIRRSRTQRMIWVSTVCVHNIFYLNSKIEIYHSSTLITEMDWSK